MAEMFTPWRDGRDAAPAAKPTQMVTLDCGFCGGRGTLRGAKCPVCWGSGQAHVRAPYQKCDRCGGTGGVQGTALTCNKCGGKGWITVRRKPNACPRCGGSGVEPEEELSPAEMHMSIRERRKAGLPPRRTMTRTPCSLCQGSGTVEEWMLGDTPFGRGPAPGPSQQEAERAEETEEPRRPRRPSLSLEDRVLVCVQQSPGVGTREVGIMLDISSAQAEQALRSLIEQGKLYPKDDRYYLASQRAGSAPAAEDEARTGIARYVARVRGE